MRTTFSCLLAILLLSLAGTSGCDSGSKSHGPSNASFNTYRPVRKTNADYIKDVIDTIFIYKQNMLQSGDRSMQSLQGRNSNDIGSVLQGAGDIQKLSNEIALYANKLNQLDTSRCPADFRACYTAYTERVTIFSNALYQTTHFNENDGLVGMIGSGIQLGMMGDQYGQDMVNAENAMLQLAQNKYGVSIPQ